MIVEPVQTPLRAAALIAIVAGAAASLAMMFRVGGRAPLFLVVVFFVWVLAPFAALAVAHVRSAAWPARARMRLYTVMLAVALASPAAYAVVAFGPPRPQPASFFMIVPAIAWLLMALAAAINRRRTPL